MAVKKKEKFTFRFFKKEDIDKKFESIIEKCKDITDNEVIIKIIDETFHNRVITGLPLEANYPKFHVYRVTRVYKNIDIAKARAFSYPKNQSLGRANIAGFPVFYGAFHHAVALKEMKEEVLANADEILYLSEWEVELSQNILAHPLLMNSKTIVGDGMASKVAKPQLEQMLKGVNKTGIKEVSDGFRQLLIRLGDLFTLDGEKHYNITSAYAHDILYSAKKKGVNISMLMYPSVETNHQGINFALHPEFADSGMMKLKTVLKLNVIKVADNNISVSISERGFGDSDGNIDWRLPSKTIKQIDYDNCVIFTYNNNMFTGKEALAMNINNSEKTVKDYLKHAMDAYSLNALGEIPFEDDIFSFTGAERKHTAILKCNKGSVIATKDGPSSIRFMKVDVEWIEDYRLSSKSVKK